MTFALDTAKDVFPPIPKKLDDMIEIAVKLGQSAGELHLGYAKRAIVLGWYICQYSQSDEVKARLAELNKEKRGRPWVPHNVAIKMMGEQATAAPVAGDSLPKKQWLSLCANAVLRAEECGKAPFSIKNVDDFLARGIDYSLLQSNLPNPARALPAPAGKQKREDSIAQALGKLADLINRRLMRIVMRRTPSIQEAHQFRDKVNPQLQYLGLSICDLEAGKRKGLAKR
jgi:hypothetical protein